MGFSLKGLTITGKVSGSTTTPPASFSISPAFMSQSTWDLNADGPLNIGSYGEWTIVPDSDITVSSKMWGAGGATGFNYANTASSPGGPTGNAGGGGYSSATIILREGVSYTIRVGQGGIRTMATDTGATYLAGGVASPSNGGAQGGGYTGVFKTSVSQANALLMAGGGGGGGTGFAGGAGGGTQGIYGSAYPIQQEGRGGTQTEGGAAALYNGCTAGAALLGGKGQNLQGSMGGGGGGYFGGGGGNIGGGGGGSGRVGTDVDVSAGTTTAGAANVPGNSGDGDRAGAGNGGDGTVLTGANGRFIISL